MFREKYIDLDRTFYQLPKSTQTDELEREFDSTLPMFEKGINWDEFIKESRVIILSEAGSGKSSEIDHATRKLRDRNIPAFFLRIEDIVDGLDEFEIGTTEEFNNWLKGEESAWIFLDSVDEAKLSDPHDFNKAIRRFARMIKNGLSRAFIFITSRTSSWSYKTDLDFCNQYLPKNSVEEYDFSEECFKVYSLTNLDEEQIEKFLIAKNVPDKKRFLAETYRQEARMFTSRPQDLVELISYWKRHGSIGSKYQLIQDSIDWRLAEIDETRAQINSISKEKLRSSAEKIAVAMILMKKFTARIADGTNQSTGIELKNTLPDWDNSDCKTLLSRPIFDDAIYGSVRFHHRSVREYLAASWFFKRLNDGSPRYPIEILFFKSHYGINVIVPSMRHILPWLAQMDEKVRVRVMEIDPHAILEGGDPAMFPCHVREQLLGKVCQSMHDKGSNWHFNNWESVKKMAKPDISSKISQLLIQYANDSTIVSLLLDSASLGGVEECIPAAVSIAVNTSLDSHARIAAVKLVRNFDEEKIVCIRHFYSADNLVIDRSLVKELIIGLNTDEESLNWLMPILASVSDVDGYRMTGLTSQLIEFIGRLDILLTAEFGKKIIVLLSQEPFIEKGYCRISKKNSWLFDVALAIIQRLLLCRNRLLFHPEFVDLLAQIHPLRHYDVIKLGNKIIPLISEWCDFKYYMYWQSVERERQRLLAKNISLRFYYQIRFFDNELQFIESDVPHLLIKINNGNNYDDQTIALTLCLKIYNESKKPRYLLNSIKKAIGENTEKREIMSNFLHPLKLSK